jgi:hypothetical protein
MNYLAKVPDDWDVIVADVSGWNQNINKIKLVKTRLKLINQDVLVKSKIDAGKAYNKTE